MSDERKLTKKEQIRKEKAEAVLKEYEEKGFSSRKIVYGVVEANFKGVLMAVPFAIVALIIYKLFGDNYVNRIYISYFYHPSFIIRCLFDCSVIVAEIVAHELIHGLVWGLMSSGNFKDISFGVIWKMLTPYCTCMKPMTKKTYIIGGLAPTIVLGFGQFLAGLFLGNRIIVYISAIMILSGGGDMLSIWSLIRKADKSKETLIFDHPTELGFVILEKDK